MEYDVTSVYEPFRRVLLERQSRLDEVLQLCCFAIQETSALPDLTSALNLVQKVPTENAAVRMEHAERVAATAKREVASNFSSLFDMATIVLWGALESAVRDFVARWIAKYPQARELDSVGKIKIRLSDYVQLSNEELHQHVVDQLDRELGAPLKKGAGRFDSLLSSVGIAVPLDNELRRTLLEMSEVRNVLVHKAGTADRRFIEACPWYGVMEKNPVSVDRTKYEKYRAAVNSYAAATLRAAHTVELAWESPSSEHTR